MSAARKVVLLAAVMGSASLTARAQPIIPNPLVRPAPPAAAASAPVSAQPAGATPRRGAERSDLLPDGLKDEAAPPSIPLAVQERVSGLYVAAIVGKAAVLRSQLAVPQVVFANASTGNPNGGGGSTAGSGGAGAAGSASGSSGRSGANAGAAGGEANARGVYRAPAYIVRNGQVVDFIDRYKVLARVTHDTVVLYLLPVDTGDERHSKVVFRGSIDSVISAPPTPSGEQLQAPDGGLDGKAWRELSNVRGAGSGVKAARTTGRGNGTSDSGTTGR